MVRNVERDVKEPVRFRLIVKADIPGHGPLQCVLADVQLPMETAKRRAELSNEQFAAILIAAKKVAKERPLLPDGWPAKGRVIPATKSMKNNLHKAKWPFELVQGDGIMVATVPVTWMRRLAQLLGLGLADVCRAKFEDAETE